MAFPKAGPRFKVPKPKEVEQDNTMVETKSLNHSQSLYTIRRAKNKTPSRKTSEKRLRWTPGTPKSPNRHTFAADVYKRRRRLGSAISQDPSLIRQIRSDLRQEMTKPGLVTAKKKALQDMAVSRLTNILQRYLYRMKLKGMYTWKYGAVEHLHHRTIELQEALDSSNDLNSHLDTNLRELENKLDKIITTESLTRRKSQKAMNLANSRTDDLKKALAMVRTDLERTRSAHHLTNERIISAGARALTKAMWRALSRDALLIWKRYHRHQGLYLRKLVIAENWHARRQLRCCFESFRVAVQQKNRCEILYRRKMRLRKRDTLRCWQSYLTTRQRAAYLLGKLCEVARRSDMRPAFHRLRSIDIILKAEQIVEETETRTNQELIQMKQNMIEKVLFAMSRLLVQNHRANLINGLRQWRRVCHQKRLAAKYHERAAWLVHAHSTVKAWNKWRKFVARRKRARRTVASIVRRLSGDERKICLDYGWNALVYNLEWLNGRQRAAKTIASFVVRQALGRQHLAFTLWTRKTRAKASHSRAERGVRRLIARFYHRQKASIFGAWLNVVRHVICMRKKLLSRILERKRRQSLQLATSQWQRKGARSVIGSMALSATHRVLRQTKWRLFRYSFAKWAMVMRRDRSLSNRLKGRKKKQDLQVMSICWEALDVERIQGLEQDRLARRAAKRMTWQLRKRVFHEWRNETLRRTRERVLLRRAAGRLRNRQIQMCYHTWIEFTKGRQNARILAKRVFRRLCSSKITGAWNKWLKDTYEYGRAQDAKRVAVVWTCFESKAYRLQRDAFRLWITDMREFVTLRALLEKGLKRIQQLKKLTTFRTWYQNASENKRQRVVLLRAAKRIKYRAINKCLGSWQDLVVRRYDARIVLRRMLNILSRNKKRVTIKKWRYWLKFARQAEARQSNYTAQLARTMARWRNRNKAAAFRSWFSRIDEIKRNRMLVARAAARWLMRSVSKCFEAWLEYADRRAHNRRIVAKFAAKWLKRLESRSFASWVAFIDMRRRVRNNMRRALSKFREKRSMQCFRIWKSIPIRRNCQRVMLSRLVRRWRTTHLRRKWAHWQLFTTADRILARKKKPSLPPPPVVEEELSTESAILRRKLERGFILPASNGIPEYNPVRDRHATYAHTEQYKKEIGRLRLLEEADRKSSRVRFPGQRQKKAIQKERRMRISMKMNKRVPPMSRRPSSAPRRRRRGGGIGGRDAALEVRRSLSLQKVGQSREAWGDNEVRPEAKNEAGSVGQERFQDALAAEAEAKRHAKVLERQVRELELSAQVAKQQNLTRQKQLQSVIASSDERMNDIMFERDNLAVEIATRKRRAKSMLADLERRLEEEIDRRDAMKRKMMQMEQEIDRERKAHLKKENLARKEALEEALKIEKAKRKNLIPQSHLKKLEKQKLHEIHLLKKSIATLEEQRVSLQEELKEEKQRGEDALNSALEDAKATLEAQQGIVRAAEDRNLRSHLQVQKEKKRCRDGLVKADEKVANMEAEMVELQKKLSTAKRLLRKEKKRSDQRLREK